jgi:cell wall-associated NlpC family hydrolase
MALDMRPEIVADAHKAVSIEKEYKRFNYTEGASRMNFVKNAWGRNPFKNPITCDCSAFITYLWSWNGCPDPNGLNYDGEGYTGTLLTHDEHIAQILSNNEVIAREKARPGDLVVYGPGAGEHVAIVVQGGLDPLTVSMGQEGDPSYVYVSQDGRIPQTFLRCDTKQIGKAKKFVRKHTKVRPVPGTVAALAKAHSQG